MKKKNHWQKVLLVVMVAALLAVAGYIIFKQMEYGAGSDFYSSLRGMQEWNPQTDQW